MMALVREIRQLLSGQVFGSIPEPAGDLTGKTVIVTGGNTGLGLEAAKYLARLNVSNLILACRSVEKGEAAAETIRNEVKSGPKTRISVWQVDLGSFASVTAFCKRVCNELPRLDGVIENAGVEMTKVELVEGLERSLTVNDVSTMLIAVGVLPKLKETASKFGTRTNLTLVGSCMHAFADDSQFDIPVPAGQDILQVLSDPKTANMPDRYQLSKLIEHLCFNEMAAQMKGEYKGVVANIVNPGWCDTELKRHKDEPFPQRMAFKLIGWTAEMGSRTLVHGLLADEKSHGKYLAECVPKRQSLFVLSKRGQQIQKSVWKDMVARLETISPGSTSVLG